LLLLLDESSEVCRVFSSARNGRIYITNNRSSSQRKKTTTTTKNPPTPTVLLDCIVERDKAKSRKESILQSEKQQHTKIMNPWRIYHHHRFAPAAVLAILVLLWAGGTSTCTAAEDDVTHPLDSLTADEFRTIVDLVTKDERITSHVRFPLVSLKTPPKALVQAWQVGDAIPRAAVAYLKDGTDAYKVEMDLVANTITSFGIAAGQCMVMAEEFAAPTEIVLQSPEFVAGLAVRNIRPDQVYCLAYSAGRFGDAIEIHHRLIKVTCDLIPAPATGNNITSSNWWAQPIENLLAIVDLTTQRVLQVLDLGMVPVATESFGYTSTEMDQRVGSTPVATRRQRQAATTTTGKEEPTTTTYPFTVEGSLVTWDIWQFRHRVDKRPGVILSQIQVYDETTLSYRSVLYEAHLSEVFVPYMDPSEAWYVIRTTTHNPTNMMATATIYSIIHRLLLFLTLTHFIIRPCPLCM
jgi:Cu2+-containing amine oxidase